MPLISIDFMIQIRRQVPDSIEPHTHEWRLFAEDAIKARIAQYGLVDWGAPYRSDAYLEEGYASLSAHPLTEVIEEH